ncbi:TIGR03085 family metal-binding protein [Williamsia sterculiae]|uniref:TIGR03085 family protein n=1 Tax=Williamsia sterculiae TaxID=1344003 RepID=A0A1N7ED76_9NOCA|nr:TIGR03085 family metal-binding protein [Williamsia sterculiae]SIR86102.1 TIGR03085 family protein [Williamsia sterculiae]
MTAARSERAAIVETLSVVGPDAPTLCEGWTTRDLTAHMVAREWRPDSLPGIAVPLLSGYTTSVQNGFAGHHYADLLDKLASGPPLWSPFRFVDRLANVGEFFVHHEDVRRVQPGWTVRDVEPEVQSALTLPVRTLGKVMLLSSPVSVRLRTPDGRTLVSAGSGPGVDVVGDPGELLLFVFGRDETEVAFDGDEDAVAELKAADRSF